MVSYLKKFSIACGLLLFTSITGVAEVPSASAKPNSIVQAQVKSVKTKANPVFETILPKLKQSSKFAILLPKVIPGSEGESQLYAVLENATANKYSIILGFSPDCGGGNACRLGTMTAQTVTSTTPKLKGKKVKLANGINAYFEDFGCGANCSDAILTWRQKKVQYSVGLKAGKVKDLLKMANSFVVP